MMIVWEATERGDLAAGVRYDELNALISMISARIENKIESSWGRGQLILSLRSLARSFAISSVCILLLSYFIAFGKIQTEYRLLDEPC
jgi:hypothetical protein